MDYLHSSNLPLLVAAILVLVAIASSLLARRFGAPLLLVFLILGMLIGVDGPGGVRYHDYQTTFTVGSLALAIILFDGGLRTRLRETRGAVAPAAMLATIGVLLTAALTGVAAHWLLGLGWLPGMLLGAMVASTDAAAVFFLLRAGGLHLNRRVGATLELESGGNDPLAVFLTLSLTLWLAQAQHPGATDLMLSPLRQAGLGIGFGALGGMAIAFALNRLDLPAGIHPLLTLAGAIGIFALTNLSGGSGFLAAYLAGLVVGNRPIRAFANVLAVFDAATWLAQGSMFLLLGILVGPRGLLVVLWPALAIAAFLLLIARPLAVAVCLAPFRFRANETAFIAWVGLRGAVGIFLASVPMLAGLDNALLYFNVAFVVVCVSLLVQGWTLRPAANLFGVALPRRDAPVRRIELDLPGQLEYELVGYRVAPDCAQLRGATLPSWARPTLTVRAGEVLTAADAGEPRADDHAYFLAPPGRVNRLDWLFAEAKQAKEIEREQFGAFSFAADVPLGALAEFYSLPIAERFHDSTAAELFAARFDGQPQIGDQLRLGDALLIVRALTDEQVSQIGLKFVGVGARVFGPEAAAASKPGLLAWIASGLRRRHRANPETRGDPP